MGGLGGDGLARGDLGDLATVGRGVGVGVGIGVGVVGLGVGCGVGLGVGVGIGLDICGGGEGLMGGNTHGGRGGEVMDMGGNGGELPLQHSAGVCIDGRSGSAGGQR